MQPNTSAIERRNGTAWRMSVYPVRKSLAFAHRADTKLALGWWGVTVYNWWRTHRALRTPLASSWVKKVSAPFTGHGRRADRSHSHDPGTPAHAAVSSRTPEIIS